MGEQLLMNIINIAITTLLVPVITLLCVFIKKKISEVTANMRNEALKNYINSATDAVSQAVITVSQTYVDDIKKSGQFDIISANEAKTKAMILARQMITNDAKAMIESATGDFNIWLDTMIEKTVAEQK